MILTATSVRETRGLPMHKTPITGTPLFSKTILPRCCLKQPTSLLSLIACSAPKANREDVESSASPRAMI
jgi:hypothetical protein